ncbi:hypothetical protein ES705_19836 [subsurface metagenome]
MERFIIKYPNGKIRQQKGINITYHYLLGVSAISWIIDTKDGEVMYGDKDETVHTDKISTYSDSSLIVSD